MTMKDTAYRFHRTHSMSKCFVDGAWVIVEETTPTRKDMFHHRIKMISQMMFVLTYSDSI